EDGEALLRGQRERGPARLARDERPGGDRDGEEDEAPDGQVPTHAVDQFERGKAREEPAGVLRFELLLAREIEERQRERERESGAPNDARCRRRPAKSSVRPAGTSHVRGRTSQAR